MSDGITIAQLAASGRKMVVQCNDCPHRRLVDPASLELPGETLVSDVGKRMRCQRCNAKPALTYPESPRDARKGRER